MKKVFVTLLVLIFTCELYATSFEKRFYRSFGANLVSELMISNRYGRINIEQSDDDSLRVSVVLTSIAKKDEKAVELLSGVDVHYSLTGEQLVVETAFIQNQGIKQALFGSGLSIDYKVSIPEEIRLRVINRDGDVSLDDFNGYLNLDVTSGNVVCGDLECENNCYIKVQNGNCMIGNVDWLNVDFANCSFDIKSCRSVKLTSKNSNGTFTKVEKMDVITSGGVINVGKIEDFVGVTNGTKFYLGDLGNIVNADITRGGLNIRSIHYSFDKIDIKAEYASIQLGFMKESGFNLELIHDKSTKFDFPQNIKLVRRATNVQDIIVGTAFVGDHNYDGNVVIRMRRGGIDIRQSE